MKERIVGRTCPYHVGTGCRLRECRLVVERHLGRYLASDESVHHIWDGDDDRLYNLYLFETVKEHTCYHAKLKRGKIEKIMKSNLL